MLGLISIPVDWVLWFALAVMIYWRSMPGEWIFDDMPIFSTMERYRFHWKLMIQWNRPLTSLTYALQALWSPTPRAVALGNQLIHVMTSIAIGNLAQVLGFSGSAAAIAALVALVHPFAVHTVGYRSARGSVLSTFCGVMALLSALSGGWAWAIWWPLSMASKEDGVLFAPWLAAAFCFRQEWVNMGWLISIGWIVLWIACRNTRTRTGWGILISRNGDAAMEEIGLPRSLPWRENAWTVVVATLARMPAWTVGLETSPHYCSQVRLRPNDWLRAAGTLVALAVLWQWNPIIAMILLVGPWIVYAVIPVPDQLMHYRNYSMLAGIALLVASFPWWCVAVIPLWAVMSSRMAACWASNLDMWTEAIRTAAGNPARAWGELGAHLMAHPSRDADALSALKNAVAHNPHHELAYENMAALHLRRNEAGDALSVMEKALQYNPYMASGHYWMGHVLESNGAIGAARGYFQHATELNPDHAGAWNRLGLSDLKSGDVARAIPSLERSLQIRDSIEPRINLAVAFRQSGNHDRAQSMMRTVHGPVRVSPSMVPLEMLQ